MTPPLVTKRIDAYIKGKDPDFQMTLDQFEQLFSIHWNDTVQLRVLAHIEEGVKKKPPVRTKKIQRLESEIKKLRENPRLSARELRLLRTAERRLQRAERRVERERKAKATKKQQQK